MKTPKPSQHRATIAGLPLPGRIIGPWYILVLLGFVVTTVSLLRGHLFGVYVGLAMFGLVVVVGLPTLWYIAERYHMSLVDKSEVHGKTESR